ncbi:hypothetical protein HDE_14313 [Halotydeus destructor]|nr:hypothetical protein HDE_14313 [Halotydeus destructor]
MEPDTREEDRVTISADDKLDLEFNDLCDDIVLEVFKYIDLKQRTCCEALSHRYTKLLPLLTTNLDDFRFRRFSSLTAREEEDMYLKLIKKSPKVKSLSFEILRQDQLLVSIFAGEETVQSYTQRLVDTCSTVEEIRIMIYSCSEFALYAAIKFLESLGTQNLIKKLELHLDYNELEGMLKLGQKLTQLCSMCHMLTSIDFVFYGPYDGGDWLSESSFDAKESFEKLWLCLVTKVIKMKISYNDADVFFGHRHWTAYQFDNLEELTPPELTGGYIRNIAENCPNLKKLVIETKSLQPLEHLLCLKKLTDLSWQYFDEESDSQRAKNKIIFDRFIRANGHNLKKLEMKIPFQSNDFFDLLPEFCPNLMNMAISLSGTPKRRFDIESIIKIPSIRKVSLACKIDIVQLDKIINKCPKIKLLKFYLPSYEKTNLSVIKDLLQAYATSHPKRKIDVKIKYCGGAYFTEFIKTIDDNLTLYTDNGRQVNDYWDE